MMRIERGLGMLVWLLWLTLAADSRADLIGWWKFDEPAGNLIDSTGLHPLGVATGRPVYSRPGVPNGTYGSIVVDSATGTSIEFGPSTVDEFFKIGTTNNNPSLNLDEHGRFTIMGWLNPQAPTLPFSTYRFFSTGVINIGSRQGWGVGLQLNGLTGANSAIRFTTYLVQDDDSNPFNVTFGEWLHLAATYNSGAIEYFLNGNPIGTEYSLFTNETVAGRLVIGGRLGANDIDQMSGRIDGVRIYDEVLSAAAIRVAAAASVPEPSSLALFVLGGCSLGGYGIAAWVRSVRRRGRAAP